MNKNKKEEIFYDIYGNPLNLKELTNNQDKDETNKLIKTRNIQTNRSLQTKTISNSSLVDYINISPNKSHPRAYLIDTITIHCVVGQCTVETLGAVFASSDRKASSNYGIG